MKEWILRYAEQSEDQSSEEDEDKDTSVFNSELDEKFDPVSFTPSGFHIVSIISAASHKFSSCRMTDTCCWPLSCVMRRRWLQNLKPRKTKQGRGPRKIGSESSSKVSAVLSTLQDIVNLRKCCHEFVSQ